MVLTLCFSIVRISEVINKENTEDDIRRGHSLQERKEKELTITSVLTKGEEGKFFSMSIFII
jgi:hypothetical protein